MSTRRGAPRLLPVLLLAMTMLGAACSAGTEEAPPTPSIIVASPSPTPVATERPLPTATIPVAATSTAAPEASDAAPLYPDVVDVRVEVEGEGRFTFHVTLSSPYDSITRYADAWRIVAPQGQVLGERILTHDHASEQPFTRSLGGVQVPPEVVQVTIEGRDQISGYGGATMTVQVPHP